MQNSVQSKLKIWPKIALEAPTFVEKLSSCGVGVVREVREVRVGGNISLSVRVIGCLSGLAEGRNNRKRN